jgi:hypothetical protein
MPYVYIGVHSVTGKIYIGYRERNVFHNLPSSEDFGKIYFTSSPPIKKTFSEFNWTIVAEFFDDQSAYDFEQSLIFENWNNPLLINKNVKYNAKRRFKCDGHTDETKRRISAATSGENNPNYGRVPTAETRSKIGAKNKGNFHSDETKELISAKIAGVNHPNFGKHHSEETKRKQSETRKAYLKDNPPKPISEETRQKRRNSMNAFLARKKAELENG